MMVSRERRFVAVVCLALIGSCAGATVAAVVARAAGIATLGPAFAGVVVGALAACAGWAKRLAPKLSDELDGWFARRRKLRWLWIAAAILAIANTARLALFVADPTQIWASAFPVMPESAEHQCLAAYVRAGELAAAGHDDLWTYADYQSDRSTSVDGLHPYLADPYEYPPTFVVAPRAALAVTDDYELIRVVWFGISAVGFLLAYLALALWMRGRAGATALLLLPAIAISYPLMFSLQWGQAHVIVLAAAIAAMLQFARGRTKTGALLLAFATTTKIFPGLLLVHLAMRRQCREVAATLVAIAALVVLAAAVLGTGPLGAFVTEHLPRMSSGEAFAFTEDNPDNHSLYGIAFKLAAMGFDTGRGLAATLAWVWGFVAVALAAHGSRGRAEPARDAILWLGILCLGTLRSPFAPTYTAIGTLWLLAIAVESRSWSKALVAIAWVLLQGFPPVGGPAVNAIASLPSQAITIGIAVLAVWPRRAAS
ncbi:MAG: DUF2029 domain-containing protein [Kofleriaceae bacterium]|nr:DUF2029 domain-containing protein [Kofleriaceae bacterium]